MKPWTAEQVAEAAGARLVAPAPSRLGPEGVTIDSRAVGAGELFVGLPGERADGGRFAPQALAAGAWGVLVAPEHADAARCAVPGALLASEDPLRALQRLATAWRRELGAQVIAVTGSTGKTSTKDILRGVLAPHIPTVASEENLNTDIGLPLAVLRAPAGTRALVLEVAMRAPGEIAELTEIAEPDVGVIVNIGPVHLELLGSLEAIAAVKAELIAGMAPNTTVVVPVDEPLLAPHLREDLRTVTFGPDGDVRLVAAEGARVEIDAAGERIALEVDFAQAHFRLNLLAAVAAALAAGVRPSGRVEVSFSGLRGERLALDDGVLVINDCYNANPMSMRAALDDLAATAPGRRIAVLGDMLELGPQAPEFHAEVGRHASARGVDVLVTVGPLSTDTAAAFDGEVHSVADAGEAAALVPELVAPGDTVLVKASRGIGLEVVADALAGAEASA
jgi:UDP-N-acetylmuramoyl-tripeptide--D-alanyl-D-alanine ligase